MPELPEVETTRRGVRCHLRGALLERIRIRCDALRWPVPDSVGRIRRQHLVDVERRAKFLILRLEHSPLVVHLGMSGSLRICSPDDALRTHDHVCFDFGARQLRLHDPRRFGCLLPLDHPRAQSLLGNSGPDALERGFSPDYLKSRLRGSARPIKNALMDQRLVAGIGNIYAAEALFLAGIRPSARSGSISKARLGQLVKHCKAVLRRAIRRGGTTLRDFVNPDGSAGYFAQTLWVYGRMGEPCRVCRTPLKNAVLGSRQTVYCPSCQKR
ncbi:MAG: bifunctional DNA-formamidopyrimidine glycosylase/DNA-(apurinic or apyrimidinic site) lyase [Gammaproteobacteria bacterium AqS3]|nr:bifunctional DNA-formamidopyrimidine glycosylase/DNA-(apurinic or apyrimidinic site) lyase [Gammaproteobacteria bacterium AqS3]